MTTAHTPGPWIAKPLTYNWSIESEQGHPVARIPLNDVTYDDLRLMNAAPDLLAALRLALPHVQACAEKDDSLARLNDERGMRGSAAQCRRVAEMRRAAAQVIADAIAKAGGAA